MFKIIGADQKEYGPISVEQIRQWISEGRLNAQTQACAEGTHDWKPLGMFPEFGFTAIHGAGEIPGAVSDAPVSIEETLARDYTLDIVRCLSRGWELFKNNFVTLFLSFLVMFIIGMAINVLIGGIAGAIVGKQTSASILFQQFLACLGALATGPLAGGLFLVFIKTIRAEPTSVGDVFLGFQKSFTDLFLGKLIPALLSVILFLPFTLISSPKFNQITEQMRHAPPDRMHELLSQLASTFASSLPVLLLCMIPITYLTVNWFFTLPLIIDKQLGVWPAMMMSWKMVHKHWFQVFGLIVVIGLLNIVGVCACCLGWLATVPIGIAVMMYAYETIFGRENA